MRKPGDIVWKRSGSGFSGLAGRGIIPEGSESMPCFICNDPDCAEWSDLWEIDESGKETGRNWCHVSECEMFDAARMTATPTAPKED
jgi:hypothetical protein